MQIVLGYLKKNKSLLLAFSIAFATYVAFFAPLFSPDHYFWGDDAKGEYVPARTYFYEKVINEHTFPFWTERMFSGFPIYADLENSYLNPINDISILIFGPLWSYKILHLLEYLIGSLSLFYLFKRKNVGLAGYTIANLVFYFSTFMLNRQIHFNIIMAFYLIPTALLLADLYIEKKQLRYILIQSFVVANAVLWGHMQSAIIVCMGIGLYMAVFSYKKIRLAPFVFYFIALMLLVTAETLPQVIPSYELYKSINGRDGLTYMAGALEPSMAVFTFLPYLLGDHLHFDRGDVGTTYTYNESYFYFGISAVLLSFLALLFLKKNRLSILAYVFIWAFLLFSFKFLNKFTSSETPIISYFRYWSRVVVLANLGVAILVGLFVDRIRDLSFRNSLFGSFFIGMPILYLWLMKKTRITSGTEQLTSLDYIRNYPYFSLLGVVVLSLAALLVFVVFYKKLPPKIRKKTLLPLKIAFIAIIFIDLFHVNKDVLTFRLRDISSYKIYPISEEFKNKRIIALNEGVDCMETVYYKNWGPFGCSQFKDDDYHEFYKENIRAIEPKTEIDRQKLKNAGITAFISKAGETTMINDSKLDVIKNDLEGKYIEKKEGNITMEISNPSDTIIKTYLKYDPFWKVKVDGKFVEIERNGIFFDFPLDEGEHIVKIYYYPKPFVLGLSLSAFLAVVIFMLYFFLKKDIYAKILK